MKQLQTTKKEKEDLVKLVNKLKKKMLKNSILISIVCLFISYFTMAQVSLSSTNFDYSNPKEYSIGGIDVEGTKFLDHKTLIQLSTLEVGSRIMVPGDKLTKASRILWEQGLFSDVQIRVKSIQGNSIFFTLYLEERPRLSKFKFEGIKRSEIDAIRDKIKLARGKIITENVIINTKNIIASHFKEKGFLNVNTTVSQVVDTITKNHVILALNIEKGKKVKIGAIDFEGNKVFTDKRLKRLMKDTKEKKFFRIFKASKFLDEAYKDDKEKIIAKYNEKGLRDAKVISDTITYNNEEELLDIGLKINEGKTYYFGDITFVGNTTYSNNELAALVGINKGDIFDQSVLETRVLGSPDSRDVHSIYLDNGYLFSQVTPIETEIRNDTIDIEVRIYEGLQARINRVSVSGNSKTNDHVIMREIRTKPGDLFSRSDIMRSQREIATLNYFDPEKLNIDVEPNQEEGTVDLNYIVEEKSSDQVELQGGYGADRIIGTFRVSFNNFSAKNMFKKGAWSPLPSGDGQRLSLSATSNGVQFQSYNISFTEPWLGGKKPNSLTIGAYHSITSNGLDRDDENRGVFKVTGASFGLGKRLKWPDDFFTLYQNISLKKYLVDQYSFGNFDDGTFYNMSYSFVLGRNSVDQPTFPRKGSNMKLSIQLTPPYSVLDGIDDYSESEIEDLNTWVEYHKWNFGANWFNSLADKLVLKTNLEYGLIGKYSDDKELTQFERFYVGGDGLSGYAVDGREVIALRGYENNSLSPSNGATIYNKYTLELRYALSLNPQSPIFALAFLEAGNTWNMINKFNPFDIKRSAGVGIRMTIPMMGIMGVDWGYGFDEIPGSPTSSGSQFHFSINQQF
ncbi:MAG: outer membrane protein assembly factor BamA [Flavobacteriia bacterium]|nr:outer membrane protein assembly factor BamA [Flavobacteriia bacterium]